jgi:hypothetical protein
VGGGVGVIVGVAVAVAVAVGVGVIVIYGIGDDGTVCVTTAGAAWPEAHRVSPIIAARAHQRNR